MDVSPRTAIAVLVIVGAIGLGTFERAQSAALGGPAPDGARYRISGGGGSGTVELKSELRDATFTFAPEVRPADRELILASVAGALETPISVIMREVGDRLAIIEQLNPIPDTLPDDLVAQFDADLVSQ